ncbi:hypothetical protein D3C83_78630 [compost metagenome]
MGAGDAVRAGLGADHMGEDFAARRLLDAEVAVLEERAEPAGLELRIAQVAH